MAYGDRPRERLIAPATPFLSVQQRDNTWALNADTFVWFDTINSITSHFEIIGEEKILIHHSGFYEICFEASSYLYSGLLDYIYYQIEEFETKTPIPGSRGYIPMSGAKQEDVHSVTIHCYAFLEKDSAIGVAAYVGNGGGTAAETVAGSGRLTIQFMPTRGWNNSAGGHIEYKGGVMR